MSDDLRVRAAAAEDARGVEEICLSTFPKEEAEAVAKLALGLLREEDEEEEEECFSLIAERGGRPIGCVAFSPAWIFDDDVGKKEFVGRWAHPRPIGSGA